MRGWLVVLMLAGCGDNQDVCGYHEQDDTSDVEMTGLSVDDHALNVCGSIDGGHYDGTLGVVDRDAYRVTVGGTGELLVEFTGDPELSIFDAVSVRVFDTGSPAQLLGQGGLDLTVADHGAFLAQVPPGDVDVVVEARASSDLVGSVPYRVRLLPGPSALCPHSAASPSYVEAKDGANQTGNDVALVDFTKSPAVVGDGSSPEDTQLSVHAGSAARVTGVAGSIGRGDQYLDRDTYAVTTDDTTDELAIRLDWPDTTLDMDILVLDPSTLEPIAAATRASTAAPELVFAAVRPRTRYLVWIGRFGMPPGPASEPYDVTVCGNYFY